MQNCVLILAPTGRDAELTLEVLAAADIDAKICADIPALLAGLKQGAGAVLTVEEALSVALKPLAGFVAAQQAWSDIPILVLTQRGADAPALSRAVDLLGNVTLLERPVRTLTLLSALRSALRARQKQFQVREASQRKDEFLASLGHELRNPLAPIRNAMGILKHLYPDTPAVVKIRTVIDRQVTHLTRLVDDLLDVARITNGKIVLQKEDVALSAVIEHVLELATAAAKAKQIRFEVDAPHQPVMLHADYARVIQIVANIVLNAIKFTPPGGEVRLSARVAGGDTDGGAREAAGAEIHFSIRDSGIGIAEEAFESIFDLFSQQKPMAGPVTSGLGIGLNLSKRFAEMHGGSIAVRSEGLGYGSEFIVTLPVVTGGERPRSPGPMPAADAPPLVSASASASVSAPTPGNRRSVLVVDDNRDAANMLQALFELEQFEVATAYDGFDAIAAVRKRVPNMIVMDLGMPGLDGYDTVRRIRQQPGTESTTIVALTGWGQSEARQKTAAAGFDHHLVKPVDFDALRSLIATVSS